VGHGLGVLVVLVQGVFWGCSGLGGILVGFCVRRNGNGGREIGGELWLFLYNA
jgi:hypothetical protein